MIKSTYKFKFGETCLVVEEETNMGFMKIGDRISKRLNRIWVTGTIEYLLVEPRKDYQTTITLTNCQTGYIEEGNDVLYDEDEEL